MMTSLSDTYPTEEAVHNISLAFHAHYLRSVSEAQGNISLLHNAFVNYHIAFQQFSAMGRPVNSIHCHLAEVDLRNDLVLIQDKVVMGSRPYRLLPLTPAAKQQWVHFLDHLDRLAVELDRHPQAKAISHAIRQLLSGADATLVPALFHLAPDLSNTIDITKGFLDEYYAEVLAMPANASRAIFATEIELLAPEVFETLGTRRPSGTDVSIALGHNEGFGLNDPFGANSMRAPLAYMRELGSVINALPQNASWAIVESELKPIRRRNKTPKLPDSVDPRVHSVYPFGTVARAESRAESARAVRKLVRECFAEVLGSGFRGRPTNDQLDRIQRMVGKLCEERGVSKRWATRLYYLYLKVGAKKLGWRIVVKKSMPAEPEPSPFTSTSLTDYQHAQDCRAWFGEYLQKQGRSKVAVEPYRRMAEICIYVALTGAVASRHRLKKLPLGLMASRYQIDDVCFVEIPVGDPAGDDPVSHRVVLDKVAKYLTAGLSQYLPSEGLSEAALSRKVAGEIDSLLDEFDRSSWGEDTWIRLEKLGKAVALLEFPGVLRAVSAREFPSRTLPLSALERLLRNSPCSVGEDEKLLMPASSGCSSEKWEIARPGEYKSQVIQISKAFNQAVKAVKREVVRSKNLSDDRKVALTLKVEKILEEDAGLSFACQVVLRWVLRLCSGKTVFGNKVVFGTVNQYAKRLFRVLKGSPDTRYMHNWSADEFTEFYYEVVEAAADRATDLVGRLMDFDAQVDVYLKRSQTVDWSSVSAVAKGDSIDLEGRIDANIITEAEYAQLIRTIRANTDFSHLDRCRLAFLVFLGFRYGLRWSEAFYLKVIDLQYSDSLDLVFVSVQDNELRELKSPAARRRVPLVGKLSEDEKEVLTDLLSRAEVWREYDADAFFALGSEAEPPLSETLASDYINALIKRVSGDAEARFHLGRHTSATRFDILGMSDREAASHRAVLTLICPEHYYEPAGLRNLWRDDATESKRMQVVATVMGHIAASPTTNGSYIHSHDWLIHQRQLHWLDLSGAQAGVVAYILGQSRDTVKRAITRSKSVHNDFDPFEFYFSKTTAFERLVVQHGALGQHSSPFTDVDALKHPSLWEIYEALQVCYVQLSKSSHQGAILVSKAVERICHSAYRVEVESGYSRFKLGRLFRQDGLRGEPLSLPVRRLNRYEHERLVDEIKHLSDSLDKYDEEQRLALNESLRLWRQSYIANRSYYLFPSLAVARSFLEGITTLGAAFARWDLLSPGREDSQGLSGLCAAFPEVEIVIDSSIRYLRQYGGLEQAGRVALRYRNPPGRKSSRRDLRLILFLLAVWDDLRSSPPPSPPAF